MLQLYIVAWVVQVLVMVLAPIVIAVWFARRYRVGLAPFLLGAGIFLVFQMLTRVPAVQLLSGALAPRLQASAPLRVLYLGFLALTAGLFESTGRWVGYRFLFGRGIPRDWKRGVAYGIGHAGMESAGFVGLSQAINLVLVGAVVVIGVQRLAGVLPGELIGQLDAAVAQISRAPWYLPLWGGLERLLSIPFHTALSLIVLLTFTRGEGYWFWVAVGLHALVDFTAPGMLQLLGWPIWVVEGYIALWSAASLWLIVRLRDRMGPPVPQTG